MKEAQYMSDSVNIKKKQEKKRIRKEKNKRLFRAMFDRKMVRVGAVGVALFILIAIFAGVLASHDPNATDKSAILQTPNSQHLLGTDQFGRDTLSRILYGSRVSLIIGVLAVSISCVAGITIGLISAYFGGWVDMIIMRLCEVVISIPAIMVSIALIAIFGNTIYDLAVILGISTIPGYIRMMRAMALSIRKRDYVQVAQMQSANSFYIMLRHVLPNSISPLLVMMMTNVGTTILAEAGLSFLGIGITIPIASWGSMVNQGRAYLISNPILAIAPGICVSLLVICLNTLGDGVRDAIDPRLRGEV